MNAAACAGLAVLAPVSWWALYTGILAYILVGVGFTAQGNFVGSHYRIDPAARA